ncbi:MAG: xanthan lyase [Muribaculaceae bacterium]
MNKNLVVTVVLVVAACCGSYSTADTLPQDVAKKVSEQLRAALPSHMSIGVPKVTKIVADDENKTLTADCNWAYSNVPFKADDIERIKQIVSECAGEAYSGYRIDVTVDGIDVANYMPQYDAKYARRHAPFVQVQDEKRRYSAGLDGNIVALWQSHGWYFEPKLNRWEWQRARVWQTVEDLYTQSYVLPFLVPMLENAGAYVMSPRERDTHSFEVIVDADGGFAQNGYHETGKGWKKGKQKGFAYSRQYYVAYENPFAEGTYRQVATTAKPKNKAVACWSAEMPEDGEYAVYVSYKTLPESADDAEYTVNSKSGSTVVKVNQQMGGGTWVYIGTYPLSKGVNKDVVTLSNMSERKGVVTADAVKIGGGMGNVWRRVECPGADDEVGYVYNDSIPYTYTPSRYPRFTEGARYWLQWSGAPDTVYTPSRLLNDYTDDYRCRGLWVNWLAGGSEVLPESKGLNIPVDMAFAFHSDAGTTVNDSIIGTLGIYMTNMFGSYADGTPRNYSRLLTDAVMTHICNDVRCCFEPNWTRRGMWDKSYYEARVPEVPTMLLELLSHHNYADMRYGLDPTFRFAVSRAIYKGMLEFISKRDGKQSVVQPLPVNSMAITEAGNDKFLLSWKATVDTLSNGGAMPTHYIVQERIGRGAFSDVAVVDEPRYVADVNDNEVHSYRVVAVNEGGRSFASEVLACGVAPQSKGAVLVVNGFTRVSGPEWFASGRGADDVAGIADRKDHGVPYVSDISYVGSQFEFRCRVPWSDDDSSGFGASNGNYETQVIAGNTFDYAALHGESILKSGYSFVSASVDAVEAGLSLSAYRMIDLILGKQKEVSIGRGAMPSKYAIFSERLMDAIEHYTEQGGNVFVSGSYVASDIWDKKQADERRITFARNVLGYRWRMSQAEASGRFYTVPAGDNGFAEMLKSQFATQPNVNTYCVESPDGILPSSKQGITVIKYADNNMGAAVATRFDNYRCVVMGFPFESIEGADHRHRLMFDVVKYLCDK